MRSELPLLSALQVALPAPPEGHSDAHPARLIPRPSFLSRHPPCLNLTKTGQQIAGSYFESKYGSLQPLGREAISRIKGTICASCILFYTLFGNMVECKVNMLISAP